ncbi:hypothetical protein Pelo_7841 [Pelomyxa schiedti]|nr:hypothetical protein Pelo_7841 [Pelomyxa schiedti]
MDQGNEELSLTPEQVSECARAAKDAILKVHQRRSRAAAPSTPGDAGTAAGCLPKATLAVLLGLVDACAAPALCPAPEGGPRSADTRPWQYLEAATRDEHEAPATGGGGSGGSGGAGAAKKKGQGQGVEEEEVFGEGSVGLVGRAAVDVRKAGGSGDCWRVLVYCLNILAVCNKLGLRKAVDTVGYRRTPGAAGMTVRMFSDNEYAKEAVDAISRQDTAAGNARFVVLCVAALILLLINVWLFTCDPFGNRR